MKPFSFSNFLCLTVGILVLLHASFSYAQCNSPIASFPYVENFESSDGNWTTSNASFWTWGAIVPGSKTVITAAASGQNCWIVGGLSGASYGSGTYALQSPCFDFSTLVNPEISFHLIWETESNYDGANLQYSTDQGLTWNSIGSTNSAANCVGVNWYNNGNVRFLGNAAGWSGSVLPGTGGNCQVGGGSGQWLLAKHLVNMLAGSNRVIFKFNFGAGTVCNGYEGFAIDDFTIRESAPSGANFTYQCLNNNSVSFQNNSAFCQTSIQWNFGDLPSGANNSSNVENPTHQFSSPGNYTIIQTVQFANNVTSIHTENIAVLGVTPSIVQPLLCSNSQNGELTCTVSGGNTSVDFSWNTVPPQTTASISNLIAGTYTVSVSAADACPASASVSLVSPMPIVVNCQLTNETCSQHNGSITSTVTGGTNAYQYLWSNNETTDFIDALTGGTYQLQVTDQNGCVQSSGNLYIQNIQVPATINLGGDTTICPGQKLLLQPGNFAQYLWQDNSTQPTFLVEQTGTYSVRVVNAAGCTTTDAIQVLVECNGIFFPTAFTPNDDRLNDAFGPVGDIASLRNYSMHIYNRWGNLVFSTYNPYKKWDGKWNGKMQAPASFTWVANYILNGIPYNNKNGVVTTIR